MISTYTVCQYRKKGVPDPDQLETKMSGGNKLHQTVGEACDNLAREVGLIKSGTSEAEQLGIKADKYHKEAVSLSDRYDAIAAPRFHSSNFKMATVLIKKSPATLEDKPGKSKQRTLTMRPRS